MFGLLKGTMKGNCDGTKPNSPLINGENNQQINPEWK